MTYTTLMTCIQTGARIFIFLHEFYFHDTLLR